MSLLSTWLIVFREGVEALLLVMMFSRLSVTEDQRRWMVSGGLGGVAAPAALAAWATAIAQQYSEVIDAFCLIVAGLVLLYVFFWSRKIMEHVRHHVQQIESGAFGRFNILSGPAVMVSTWFIVAREMTELSLMLYSNYNGDPFTTIQGILLAAVSVMFVWYFFESITSKIPVSRFFYWTSWIFGAFGLYYLYEGIEKTVDLIK